MHEKRRTVREKHALCVDDARYAKNDTRYVQHDARCLRINLFVKTPHCCNTCVQMPNCFKMGVNMPKGFKPVCGNAKDAYGKCYLEFDNAYVGTA